MFRIYKHMGTLISKTAGILFCGLTGLGLVGAEERMDLSGTWKFQLDMMGFGKTPGSELYQKDLNDTIPLPGTTDQAGKGIVNNARHVDRLTRKFEYMGQAWYRRSVVIPESWKGKEITLYLERCHWEATVYVDGKQVGMDERLSTPNRFVLTKELTPGEHTLTICMDNRLKYPMDQWNHGTTEYTQTNWNGIVGDIELVADDKINLRKLKVTPDAKGKKIKTDVTLSNPDKVKLEGEVTFTVREKDGDVVKTEKSALSSSDEFPVLSVDINMGDGVKLWDEFNPNLYEIEVSLSANGMSDTEKSVFGMRDVAQGKHHIQVNGRNIHLRGALDCAVFPITGHPAMNVAEWEKIFRTVKSYGLNHVRFHSWCPPRAAFEAGDKVGIYLQAELPMWIKDVGKYPARRDFFEKEMYAILDEYGNHPSFVLMCNGNENEGDFNVLEDLVKKAQAYDNRRLYSASTARTHVKADQYYVSHVSSKGGITVYEGLPSTMWDKRQESDIDVPVIAHETGQRCMFPDFKEMKKYTGVLEPRNFEVYRDRLDANGMLAQAEDFLKATGTHTVLQYKEVNESLLRTPNSGGFQLLGLSDFPGQGCAFVGILDAFWESKGLVSPEKYRESCAPTVLLCRIPKRVYNSGETLEPQFEIYHYGEKAIGKGELNWSLETEAGAVVQKGVIPMKEIPCSTLEQLGSLKIPLAAVTRPEKLVLKLACGQDLKNSWDVWVYPASGVVPPAEGYVLARDWDQSAKQALTEGKNVLLVPRDAKGRKTRFASHFWNPIMFRWDPMIVGTMIDKKSKAFEGFPTDMYADWQWWDILNNSQAVDLTSLRKLTPVIQSVDSYEKNRKLGIAFEAAVGKGKLFVLCTDVDKDMPNRPATRQLLQSVGAYVGGKDFQPKTTLNFAELDMVFGEAPVKAENAGDSEAVKQLLNK